MKDTGFASTPSLNAKSQATLRFDPATRRVYYYKTEEEKELQLSISGTVDED